MKLNPDCIRDVLMELESKTDGISFVSYSFNKENTTFPLTDKYTAVEIRYHITQCEASGFFINSNWTLDGTFFVLDISPQAHEFLANIRSQSLWNKTKNKAAEIGVSSLQALMQIATALATSQIQSLLQ